MTVLRFAQTKGTIKRVVRHHPGWQLWELLPQAWKGSVILLLEPKKRQCCLVERWSTREQWKTCQPFCSHPQASSLFQSTQREAGKEAWRHSLWGHPPETQDGMGVLSGELSAPDAHVECLADQHWLRGEFSAVPEKESIYKESTVTLMSKNSRVWLGCNLMTEHLPNMHKALVWSPAMKTHNKTKTKKPKPEFGCSHMVHLQRLSPEGQTCAKGQSKAQWTHWRAGLGESVWDDIVSCVYS